MTEDQSQRPTGSIMHDFQKLGRALRYPQFARRSGKVLFTEHAFIIPRLFTGERVLVMSGRGTYSLRMDDPCDQWEHPHYVPRQPQGDTAVWYRGWEVNYDWQSEFWTGQGWRAYKGGCDLGARSVSGGRYMEVIHEIDFEEDE